MYKFRITELKLDKELNFSLQLIYGVGRSKVNFLLAKLELGFLFLLIV